MSLMEYPCVHNLALAVEQTSTDVLSRYKYSRTESACRTTPPLLRGAAGSPRRVVAERQAAAGGASGAGGCYAVHSAPWLFHIGELTGRAYKKGAENDVPAPAFMKGKSLSHEPAAPEEGLDVGVAATEGAVGLGGFQGVAGRQHVAFELCGKLGVEHVA